MAQAFVNKFHEIEGESIGERQKNLNKFLKNVSIIPEEKEFILDNLCPKTYLENLFYVDILIYFKETSRLLEIFKEGNGAYVSKIMKQPWFFKEAFNNIAPETFVADVLPLFSFSIKIKLLKSISHVYSEENIDQVFDYAVNRYGLALAQTFLTSCSSEKITSVLTNYKIKLSTHQLKSVYKKDPNLITTYLQEQKQYHKENIFDNNFLTYLAQSNPAYFWELTEKHQIDSSLKFGRRTTNRVLPTKAQEIVSDPDKYLNYFRHETLVRKLNKQGCFKQLYSNIFPRDIEHFRNKNALCNTLLKYYPKSDQYNLFINTFNDIVKEDIWKYTSYIRNDLLKVIPDSKLREAWAQIKFKESGDEKYLRYYQIKQSIALIKERINTTSSIKGRTKLVSLLVKSCALNKDLKALEEVLKYFCIRHKNDDKTTRQEFLQAIVFHCKLKEFTTAHWKYIIEIINISNLNREYMYYNSMFRIKHLEYLYNNNGSEEDKKHFILEYIQEQIEFASSTFSRLEESDNSELQETVLLHVFEHLDNLLKPHTNLDCSFMKSQVIGNIFWFNMKYPEKRINIEENETLAEHLRSILKGGQYLTYPLDRHIPKIVRKLNRTDFENELLKFCFEDETLKRNSLPKLLCWFLNYDPMVIVTHFDLVMGAMPSKRWHIWNTIKKYSHLSLDDNVVKHCLQHIENEKDDQKPEFAEALSVIETPEFYIKTMEKLNLIPTSSKVSVDDKESRTLFQIQKMYLKNFRNLWNPSKYVPLLIEKFSQGDYLRESLTPLYIAFHKIPESTLEGYLDKIAANKAVSVKKHGLYFAIYVFDRKMVAQIFNDFQENKNVSLQKCLCLSSLRYFTKTQTQEYFERLLSYLQFLKVQDTESLEILSSVQIPKKFKPYYIVHLWDLLERLKANPNAVGFNKLMSKVLDNIDKACLANLPEEFCKGLVKNYFASSLKKGEEINNIFDFAIRFLMYHNNQTDNFNFVTLLLTNFKTQFWNSKGKEQSLIHTFFDTFFSIASGEDVDLEFVTKFSTEWKKVFTENETFKEHILLHLLIVKKGAKGDVVEYSKQLVHFSEEISATYGEFIFSKFITIIADYCVFGNEKEIIALLTEILKYKTSALSCILVMELLTIKGDLFYFGGIRPRYREIVSILQQITDPKVQLCYNLFTKK